MTLNSAGTITQMGGTITAAALTGSSVGGASLTRANQVANLGNVSGGFSNTGSGALSFTDARSLTTANTISSAGDLTLPRRRRART